jgi:hypothetical protein
MVLRDAIVTPACSCVRGDRKCFAYGKSVDSVQHIAGGKRALAALGYAAEVAALREKYRIACEGGKRE